MTRACPAARSRRRAASVPVPQPAASPEELCERLLRRQIESALLRLQNQRASAAEGFLALLDSPPLPPG